MYRGGFGDVWKHQYQGREVTVKVLRIYTTSNLEKIARVGRQSSPFPTSLPSADKESQRFCKEFVPWKVLRHPNVLPLLGVRMSENEFARGLNYLHGRGMVHGDLKKVRLQKSG